MTVAFTGHRPNNLGGYKTPNPTFRWICWRLREELEALKPDRAITGMALGVDQWAAAICLDKGIPYIAAVPFVGQKKTWPAASQRSYHLLLESAAEVVTVCKGEYAPEKMQRRNEWMVDHCDKLIAVWDGTAGGTGNCVRYAQKKKKEIVRIIP